MVSSISIEFPLSNGFITIIDEKDLPKISQWRWHGRDCKSGIYAARTYSKRINGIRTVPTIYLHRFLVDAPTGMQVDHKNGNTLDNRTANLELVTPDENLARRRWHLWTP